MMTPITLILIFLLSLIPSSSQTSALHNCATIQEKVYDTCMNLTLEATLQYSFDGSNSTLSVVFEAAPPNKTGWVSWGLNPTNLSMIGAQVIVCFKNDYGLVIKTYDIKSYYLLVPGKLYYEVWGVRAEMANGRIMIFANVKIPQHLSTVNIIWQTGPKVDKLGNPLQHFGADENLQSTATIKLTTGDSSESLIWWRKVHAIISFVCWGVLHQIGLIEARYGKYILPYPLWYYVHICWTSLASIVGLGDFVLGLVIGSKTHGLHFTGHLVIGCILACFAMVQLSSLFLMPKEDVKNMSRWEVIHIVVGYLIAIVAPSNIYTGFEMINAEKKWISYYNRWIIAQIGIAVFDLIAIAVFKCFKKWMGPADPTENPGYVQLDKPKPKESEMQPNRLENQ